MKKFISQVFKISAQVSQDNYFSKKLAHETDIADLAFDHYHGLVDYYIIDVRSKRNYEECHIPSAISYPNGVIPKGVIPEGAKIVVYCWGPSCNGATKAAYKLLNEGYRVKELLGGIEYWVKENCPTKGTITPDKNLYWDYSSLIEK